MYTSTDLDVLAATDEVAPPDVSTCSDLPIAIFGRGSPGSDATREDPAIFKDEVEPWTWHAPAASGLGDVATADSASFERPTSYELLQAARAHRSFIVDEVILAAIEAVGAFARRAHARYRRQRQAGAIRDALQQLDDHTLRDLGFDRSEIRSIAAEATGDAEYTRVRALRTSHGVPSTHRA